MIFSMSCSTMPAFQASMTPWTSSASVGPLAPPAQPAITATAKMPTKPFTIVAFFTFLFLPSFVPILP